MNNINKKAISEVIEILNHTDVSLTEKIPKDFKRFLIENADDTYIPNIRFESDNWDNNIENDTKSMLALIYRDFIATEAEKNEILELEKKEMNQLEDEARKKYNPSSLFKNKADTIDSNKQLIAIKEDPWYKKIIKIILKFLAADSKKVSKEFKYGQ